MKQNKSANHTAKKSLWDFAVEIYAFPDVEKVCLELQNSYHANVNVILWCLWLEEEGIILSSTWIDDVLIKIDNVSQMTVANLRDVRRQLMEGGNFTKVQAQTISKHILNAELLIEKVLLHRLQDLTKRFIELNETEIIENPERLDLQFYLDFLQIPNSAHFSHTLSQLSSQQTA